LFDVNNILLVVKLLTRDPTGLEMETEMEMEMVFNGYSLTGFSITIYNNII